MGSVKARAVMVLGAFSVMAGAYAFKGWQLEKDAQQACETMLEGYREMLSDSGPSGVDGLKFAIQARPYTSYGHLKACADLSALAKRIEAAHDAKVRPVTPARSMPLTGAGPGPRAKLYATPSVDAGGPTP